MTRAIVLTLCTSILALAAPMTGAQEPAKTAFRGTPRAPGNIGFVSNLSPDGRALTVIFDNLFEAVEPARKGAAGTLGQTASQTRVFTLEVPFATDQRSVKMAMDLRGFATADPDACVKLIAHAGDATTVIDVQKSSASGSPPVKLKGKSKAAILAAHGAKAEDAGDFAQRVVFTVQRHAAQPVCQVTVILLAEHDTEAESGGGLVAVDSLDLSFDGAEQGQYRR